MLKQNNSNPALPAPCLPACLTCWCHQGRSGLTIWGNKPQGGRRSTSVKPSLWKLPKQEKLQQPHKRYFISDTCIGVGPLYIIGDWYLREELLVAPHWHPIQSNSRQDENSRYRARYPSLLPIDQSEKRIEDQSTNQM